jgi:hypothetical protein
MVKKTEKIRYEIDPQNRLIYEKTREESEVPRFRVVLDGNFEIDENNYVSCHVKNRKTLISHNRLNSGAPGPWIRSIIFA